MEDDKRKYKQIIIINNIYNCNQCDNYRFDMEDGYICNNECPSKEVNKGGIGIPDWCKLPDIFLNKKDGVNPRRCETCKNIECKFYEDRGTSRSLIDRDGRMASAAILTSEVGCISYK
jgi:hypothetical protein